MVFYNWVSIQPTSVYMNGNFTSLFWLVCFTWGHCILFLFINIVQYVGRWNSWNFFACNINETVIKEIGILFMLSLFIYFCWYWFFVNTIYELLALLHQWFHVGLYPAHGKYMCSYKLENIPTRFYQSKEVQQFFILNQNLWKLITFLLMMDSWCTHLNWLSRFRLCVCQYRYYSGIP